MKALKTLLLVVAVLVLANFAFAQTWTQTTAPIANWQSVASSADGTRLVAAAGGYFGAANGVGPIYLSTNSGVSWMQSSAPVTSWLHVSSSADGSKLVAVGNDIFYSTNFGSTWTQASAPVPFEFWSSVASSADGTRLAAGELGGSVLIPREIYLSTNSGANWYPAGVKGSSAALSADGAKLVALEYRASTGFIMLSTNAGVTWTSNNIANSQLWWAAASSADGVKLAAAAGGTVGNSSGSIYTSTNSGATWTSNNALNLKWSSVASSADGTKLVAAVAGSGIYTSIDSGTTWVSNSVPATNWTSVASSADGNKLVAAALNGGIWTLQSQPIPQLTISPTNGNARLSWTIPSTNFVLQESSNLVSWADMTNPPVLNLTNLQNEVLLTPSNNTGFYRLKTP